MKVSEIRDLFRLRPPPVARRNRQLARSFAVADLERIASRRLPRSVAGYLNGGADREQTLVANTDAFRSWAFTPRVLVDVDTVDLQADYLGRSWSSPLGLAPTGYTKMFTPAGESAVAEAALARGIPYAVSTMATTAVPDLIREANGSEAPPWFQLYALRDHAVTYRLLDRMQDAGVDVLELAVDVPVSGNRLRDRHTGFTVPPQLTLGSMVDIGLRPSYWLGMVRNPALTFANFAGIGGGIDAGSIEEISSQFSPSFTWDDLVELRTRWHGNILIKGLLNAQQSRRSVDLGVDGIHLSNHGGRQLDSAASPLAVLQDVRAELGEDTPIIVDSGVRTGVDIALALALGANAAFIGRPYLWGLVVAEEAGVLHVIDILNAELARTMRLLGVRSVAELRRCGPDLVQPVLREIGGRT